jgi:hypothetical protein
MKNSSIYILLLTVLVYSCDTPKEESKAVVEFQEAYSKASCDIFYDCCSSNPESLWQNYSTIEECYEDQLNATRMSINSDYYIITEENLDNVLTSYSAYFSMECQENVNQSTIDSFETVFSSAFAPRKKPGETCLVQSHCISDRCAFDINTESFRCKARGQQGEDCLGSTCEDGLACIGAKCLPELQNGDPCNNGNCGYQDQFCNSESICETKHATGDTCSENIQCITNNCSDTGECIENSYAKEDMCG